MKVSDVQHLKNKTGSILIGGMYVEVQILDIRETWGNVQYLISPVTGSGSIWVFGSRVEVNEDTISIPR